MHFLDIFTLITTGLMVGNELTVSLFIHPVMLKLEARAQGHVLSLFAGLLGRVMPFWYALCLILLLWETVVHRGQRAFPFLLGATLLWVVIIVFTIVVLVPINNRSAKLEEATPIEKWLPEHMRWERLHRVRILGLLIALALVTHSLLLAG